MADCNLRNIEVELGQKLDQTAIIWLSLPGFCQALCALRPLKPRFSLPGSPQCAISLGLRHISSQSEARTGEPWPIRGRQHQPNAEKCISDKNIFLSDRSSMSENPCTMYMGMVLTCVCICWGEQWRTYRQHVYYLQNSLKIGRSLKYLSCSLRAGAILCCLPPVISPGGQEIAGEILSQYQGRDRNIQFPSRPCSDSERELHFERKESV